MDATSALDPPEENNVELRPFVRGPSTRRAHASRISTVVGKGAGRSAATFLDKYLSSSHQRKNGLLILLSVLCVSLLIMSMIKKGTVGIEQKIELGEKEKVVHHVDLDHHYQEENAVEGKVVEKKVDVVSKPEEVKEDVKVEKSERNKQKFDEPEEETKTETPKEVTAETPKEVTAETPKEVTAETPKEVTNETPKEEGTKIEKPKAHVKVDHAGYQPTEMIKPTFYLPGTEDAPRGSAAGGGFDYPLTNHFQFRDPDSPTASSWGFFDFEDPKEEWRGKVRPIPDFESVPHRDVKGSDFPDGAWQKDDEYMTEFLNEAKKLVNRTMEGIYAEYGVGVAGGDLSKLTEEQLKQREMFAPIKILQNIDDDAEYNARGNGMWTTKDSLDGLARRILHAIITQDTFHIVLGGHSAAAGHGNGFNQSYIIQAGFVLEPVFAHLGVTLRTYNLAQGGLGTVQQAMAGMDLRGKETDVIMWDSSMTEKSQELFHFFMKQALISGSRAPFMIGSGFGNMREFNRIAAANIGEAGDGWNGPETLSEEQALTVPWAARYLNCPRGQNEICKAHEYEGNGCWVERNDFTPPTPQNERPGGQASWHPGNRVHKIRGRRVALLILRGLEHALEKWEELTKKDGHPLADEHWHVADFYKAIINKATEVPGCPKLDMHEIGKGRRRGLRANETDRQLANAVEYWPWRICNLPLNGRSLFGPRFNPVETSLLSILKPNPMGEIDPNPNNAYVWPPIYYPPELIGPWNVPPDNDIDIEKIAGARRLNEVVSIDDPDKVIPGYGYDVRWGKPGVCDGTAHSWCDKHEEATCLMGGTQDNHGMICFNGLSGWVVFDVKGVKNGFIGAKMESWHLAKDNKVTAGWTEVNNGGKGNYEKSGRARILHEQNQRAMALDQIRLMDEEIEREILQDPERRLLKGGKSCGLGENYIFEFAINGKITSWTKEQFCEQYTRLAYNTDMVRFMDDEKQSGDFELALRIKNNGSTEEMCITHLYWS